MSSDEAEKAAREYENTATTFMGQQKTFQAFLAGVEWALRKAEEIANAPENGMATEEVAFVEQLRSILKDPNAR